MPDFILDESGAITVDWVVLTAALVGLGLAAMAVVSGGIEDLSGDIDAQLASQEISTAFAGVAGAVGALGDLLSTNFSGALSGWNGGAQVDLAGFGDVLQLGPGVLATTQVTIPPGATEATITFDLIGADDLSGAPATVFVNGQPVAIYSDNHGNISTSSPSVAGIAVEMDQHYTNDPMGSGNHGHDSRVPYTITVSDPGDSLTFGVGSGSGEPITDEFYALDDVNISAS